MSAEIKAIHSIRNDLTPILWFAELAMAGDLQAQKLVIKELIDRSDAINAELDVLTTAVRQMAPAAARPDRVPTGPSSIISATSGFSAASSERISPDWISSAPR